MNLNLIAGQIAEMLELDERFSNVGAPMPREDGGYDIPAADRQGNTFWLVVQA